MAVLRFHPVHEVGNVHWDEEANTYRATVNGEEFMGSRNSDGLKERNTFHLRAAAAFEAMARCAEARENRLKAEELDRARIRSEVMQEAGYPRTDEEGYRILGRSNPLAQRAVDLAVEARLKLERQGLA